MRPLDSGDNAPAATGRSEAVLYVEDDAVNFRVAQVILGTKYEVVHAPNDQIACSLLRLRGPEFAAILMDVQLIGSKLDGMELARLVRGNLRGLNLPAYAERVPVLPNVPIIFVTAYGTLYSESILMNAGGNRVLSKPVSATTLELALSSIFLERVQSSGKKADPVPKR